MSAGRPLGIGDIVRLHTSETKMAVLDVMASDTAGRPRLLKCVWVDPFSGEKRYDWFGEDNIRRTRPA